MEVLTARSLTLNMCALKLRLLDCALQLHGWTRSKPSRIAAHLYYTLVSHLLLWQGVLKFYFMEKIEKFTSLVDERSNSPEGKGCLFFISNFFSGLRCFISVVIDVMRGVPSFF